MCSHSINIKRDRIKISHMPKTTLNSLGISPYLAIQTTPQGYAVICTTQMNWTEA